MKSTKEPYHEKLMFVAVTLCFVQKNENLNFANHCNLKNLIDFEEKNG